MTSLVVFRSKLTGNSNGNSCEHSTNDGNLFNPLLSPILETSHERLSMSSEHRSLEKSLKTTEINEVSMNNGSNEIFMQRYEQFRKKFHQIQDHLFTMNQNLKELNVIIDMMRLDPTLNELVEPIEARLTLIRVKIDQIDRMNDEKHFNEVISSSICQATPILDYQTLFTSIQLSMNQKSTLIDHLNNEYRCIKHQINQYGTKLKHREKLLMELSTQIEKSFQQDDRSVSQTIIDEHRQQTAEFRRLSEEFQRLQIENEHLKIGVQENLQRISRLTSSATNKR